MATITINGKPFDFAKGETILQVALRNGIEIPHYCYHPGLSVVANCRICLAEVWAPNPRNDNKLEPIPKLLPTCQTPCGDGQAVYMDSPKTIANQKAVMEYLLINHPVDCPVCDQAGECHLQDYSYQYGRGQSRFQEQKNKQPKKDIGDHVLLYSDRCIMCTRCVRFTREVTGTGELIVDGRGSTEQIDIFPGIPLNNELSANVIDLCPVGALLDKDFLFQQRVWFLTKTPSIDGITASGDNISVEHNNGRVYRIKPRFNPEVNQWWITDEVRYGWKFVHREDRLTLPRIKGEEPFEPAEAPLAWESAIERTTTLLSQARRIGLLISPMLSCEDAYLLASHVLSIDPGAVLGVGPVPITGQDRTLAGGFTISAEKAPNARGVRRVLGKLVNRVHEATAFQAAIASDGIDTLLITGNYPSEWVTPAFAGAVAGHTVILIDTLPTTLTATADVVLPAATWIEKSGTFENRSGRLQTFERAFEPIDFCKSESQIALDLKAAMLQSTPEVFHSGAVRAAIAQRLQLEGFAQLPTAEGHGHVESDMVIAEL